MTAKCKTCKFWQVANGYNGYCHRYPPQLCMMGQAPRFSYQSQRPLLSANDFCGEHTPTEPVLEWSSYTLIRDGEFFGRVSKCGFKHVWFVMIGDKEAGDYKTIEAAKEALKEAALSTGDK